MELDAVGKLGGDRVPQFGDGVDQPGLGVDAEKGLGGQPVLGRDERRGGGDAVELPGLLDGGAEGGQLPLCQGSGRGEDGDGGDLVVTDEVEVPLPDDGGLGGGGKEARLVVLGDLAYAPEVGPPDPCADEPEED